MSELDDAARRGDLKVDGAVMLRSRPVLNADGSTSTEEPGVEVNASKAAVEPVWYLPGVAERFGISETLLRRALFEDTGGMYPELITRPDIKVFLPHIGSLAVYIFGNPAFMSDESKKLTLRVHDEERLPTKREMRSFRRTHNADEVQCNQNAEHSIKQQRLNLRPRNFACTST